MQINTRHFGVHQVDANKIIKFPLGIPGFESHKEYQLLHEEKDKPIVYYLQSIEDPALSFSLVKPVQFSINYDIELSDNDVKLLELKEPADVAILFLVSRNGDAHGGKIHPHINCPILINTRKRVGIQKVIAELDYEINVSVVLRER